MEHSQRAQRSYRWVRAVHAVHAAHTELEALKERAQVTVSVVWLVGGRWQRSDGCVPWLRSRQRATR
jgi:hypothetical protein